nr:uncharacterized protein LOC104109333 [Nicotiana tomentosiformis]
MDAHAGLLLRLLARFCELVPVVFPPQVQLHQKPGASAMFPNPNKKREHSWEDHEQYLRIVLQTLREEKLYAKFSKCEFWLNSASFLGHMVFSEGIKLDPKKVEVVQSCPRLSSATDSEFSRLGWALANWFVRLDISEPSRVLACVISHTFYFSALSCVSMGIPFACPEGLGVARDAKKVSIGDDGVLLMKGRICVSNVDGLLEYILEEAHSLRYSIYLGAAKMHQGLRQHYWWRRMKKYIVEYMARCLNYQ